MAKSVDALRAEDLLERAYALDNEADAKALYRDWAKTYDETMLEGLGYLTPQNTAELLSTHITDKDIRILDVGSGTGLAGAELSAQGFINIDALDYSPEMLKVAEHRDIYQNLIEADLNLPLKISSESYDAIICTGTFTHAHVGANCLDELTRILVTGGIIACTVQKDIWYTTGFDQKVSKLEAAGVIKTLSREMGNYFKSSTEPEGWYIVWQKTK